MIILGKVKEIYKDNSLPSIRDIIAEKPPVYKEQILKYLKNGKRGAVAVGYANDVITGERIPGELYCLSDDEYGWRSDTIYYFEKYNMALDPEFIKKVGGHYDE